VARPRHSSAPPPAYPAGSQPAAALSALPGVPPHLQKTVAPPSPSRASPIPQPQPQPQPPPMAMPQPQMPQMLQPQMAAPQPVLQPATTLPLPQIPARPSIPPLINAPPPAVLGTDPMLAKTSLPTTLPGQGMPPAPAMPYSYPSIADMHKHGQMLVVGNGAARDATSTALVQPTPFGGVPAAAVPAYTVPTVSRRTKLLLAGAALTLLAAIATIAIMKSSESSASDEPSSGKGGSGSATRDRATNGSGDSGSGAMAGSDAEQKTITQVDPTKPDPTKPDPGRQDPAQLAPQDPPTPDPAKQDSEPAKPDPAKQDSEPAKPDPAKADSPEPESPKPPKTGPPRPSRPTTKSPKADPPKAPKVTPPPRRPSVATADKPDAAAVRSKATELYRARKFGEAAAVLRQFAATASGPEVTDLRSTASVYEQLGATYNRGMSPGAKPADAFKDLRTAQNLDSSSVAGEFTSEIKTRLAQIAPKAAISFYVSKEYSLAFQAVRTAEAGGVSNADTKLVRQKLENTASELYAAASKEIGSNPEAAKAKLRQIKGIVDAKSPILAKATALLNGN
jgi:hypothetical protein